jgi:hypothetical protein
MFEWAVYKALNGVLSEYFTNFSSERLKISALAGKPSVVAKAWSRYLLTTSSIFLLREH